MPESQASNQDDRDACNAGALTSYKRWRRENPDRPFPEFLDQHPHTDIDLLMEIASTDLIHMISEGFDIRAEY